MLKKKLMEENMQKISFGFSVLLKVLLIIVTDWGVVAEWVRASTFEINMLGQDGSSAIVTTWCQKIWDVSNP